jgi:hypothetical protein
MAAAIATTRLVQAASMCLVAGLSNTDEEDGGSD